MSGASDTTRAFLEAIRESPEDDTPRLVYADWLDEHIDCTDSIGAAHRQRAEFIRLQCELTRLPGNDPSRREKERREREFIQENRASWLGPLDKVIRTCTFRRGFPEDLTIRPRALVESSAELEQRIPAARVELYGGFRNPALVDLASCPSLNWLSGLKWENRDVFDEGFTALATSSNLPHLAEISVRWSRISVAGIRALATSPHRSALRRLSLRDLNLPAEAAIALAGPDVPFRLHSLDLHGNQIGTKGAKALAQAEHLEELRELGLFFCGIGNTGAIALAKSPYLRSLSKLDLHNNELTTKSLRALAESPLIDGIRDLTLGCDSIGDAGAEILAACPRLAQLERLSLYQTEITDTGAEALAGSPYLTNLIDLDLVVNEIRDRGSQALFDSTHLLRLERIHLGSLLVAEKFISSEQRKQWQKRLGKGARV